MVPLPPVSFLLKKNMGSSFLSKNVFLSEKKEPVPGSCVAFLKLRDGRPDFTERFRNPLLS